METKKEKNLFQEAYPLQQKVFKFHNVSKDVILGNKKVKKDVKRKAKKLPLDKIQRRIEESQEKMAELILKQYIPIRQKSLPVVNSQTKKHTESISTRKIKNRFGLKLFEENGNKNSNLGEEVNVPTQRSSTESDRPPGIRLVDISLLKDPKSCLPMSKNVQEQKISQPKVIEYNSSEPPNIPSPGWANSPCQSHTEDTEDAPLDLRKKRPADYIEEEILPLDLSKKTNNNVEREHYEHEHTEEPPPLMLIKEPLNKAPAPVLPKQNESLPIDNKNDPSITKNNKQMITLDCRDKSQSQNQPAIRIPQLLQLQPIQVVFTTNPVHQVNKVKAAGQTEVFQTEAQQPVTPLSPSESTRQKIKTKLHEKSSIKQNQPPTTSVQPIQMVFTDGKFVQVLPSQSIQNDPNSGPSLVKKPRKRRSLEDKNKPSLSTLLEPSPIKSTLATDRLAVLNSHEYTCGTNNNLSNHISNQNQQNPEAKDTHSKTSNGMVKTNEMVTSNGGIFCTFKNMNRMKSIRTNAKTRRKRFKPDQPSGITSEQKQIFTQE